jgi:hypothetical protein
VDNLDDEIPEVELVKSTAERRVQTIRAQGSPVEVMAAMKKYEENQQKQKKRRDLL